MTKKCQGQHTKLLKLHEGLGEREGERERRTEGVEDGERDRDTHREMRERENKLGHI